MKRFRYWLAVALLSLPLTGCWGAKEIEHMVYANSIGFDYANGKYILYIQMINFGGIAKKEAGSQPAVQKVYLGKAEGDTVGAAFFDLYASSQQRIAWSHVKTLLFSEAALKKGVVNEILDLWERYYEFRYTVWTMATKEPIEEVLTTHSNVDLSILYSQLNNPDNPYTQSSIVAPLYLYKFIWSWNEKTMTTRLPYLLIDRGGWTDDREPSPKLLVGGVCLLQNKQLLGCMPRRQTLGLRWLEKETVRTPLKLKDVGSPDEPITAMFAMEHIKPSVVPEVRDGKARFQISVSMSGNLSQLSGPISESKLESITAEEIKKQIWETYRHGLNMGADVYQLSDKLYRAMPKEWHELAEKGRIALDQDSISSMEVKVNLHSGGISKVRQK